MRGSYMPDKYGDIIILMTIIRRLGYIFENLIGRFYQNVDAGQFYAGRDIIKLLASILISEGCDDIFDAGKIITVCDEAVTCLIQGFLPVFVVRSRLHRNYRLSHTEGCAEGLFFCLPTAGLSFVRWRGV